MPADLTPVQTFPAGVTVPVPGDPASSAALYNGPKKVSQAVANALAYLAALGLGPSFGFVDPTGKTAPPAIAGVGSGSGPKRTQIYEDLTALAAAVGASLYEVALVPNYGRFFWLSSQINAADGQYVVNDSATGQWVRDDYFRRGHRSGDAPLITGEKGPNNGIAALDGAGKIYLAELPPIETLRVVDDLSTIHGNHYQDIVLANPFGIAVGQPSGLFVWEDSRSYGPDQYVVNDDWESYTTAWHTATHYNLGARVLVGGEVYEAIKPGTSGATGPTGMGLSLDGTVEWNHINPGHWVDMLRFRRNVAGGVAGLGTDGKVANGQLKLVAVPWRANEDVVPGDRRTNDGGKVYECITAGTTDVGGAGHDGPSGTGTNIADLTAHWKYAEAAVGTERAVVWSKGGAMDEGELPYPVVDSGPAAAPSLVKTNADGMVDHSLLAGQVPRVWGTVLTGAPSPTLTTPPGSLFPTPSYFTVPAGGDPAAGKKVLRMAIAAMTTPAAVFAVGSVDDDPRYRLVAYNIASGSLDFVLINDVGAIIDMDGMLTRVVRFSISF